MGRAARRLHRDPQLTAPRPSVSTGTAAPRAPPRRLHGDCSTQAAPGRQRAVSIGTCVVARALAAGMPRSRLAADQALSARLCAGHHAQATLSTAALESFLLCHPPFRGGSPHVIAPSRTSDKAEQRGQTAGCETQEETWTLRPTFAWSQRKPGILRTCDGKVGFLV